MAPTGVNCVVGLVFPQAGAALLNGLLLSYEAAFTERSRRPLHTAPSDPAALRSVVPGTAQATPPGARKICRMVIETWGHEQVPAPSMVTDLLRRHGPIVPPPDDATQTGSALSTNCPTVCGRWISRATSRLPVGAAPLTMLDDHSRLALATIACNRQDRHLHGPGVAARHSGAFGAHQFRQQAPWARPVPRSLSTLMLADCLAAQQPQQLPPADQRQQRFHLAPEGRGAARANHNLAHAQTMLR